MLKEEIRKKIKLIEITTRKKVDDALTGNYKSQFKGQGLQFAEHRQYIPGDDVRHIDWKVSARARETVIKKYDEERELVIFLVIDLSFSSSFGSTLKTKQEMIAETASMIATAAQQTGDKIGALLFDGEVSKIIPPKKGRNHVLTLIEAILTFQASKKGTDLKGALQATQRLMKHAGVVFVISDFYARNYETALKKLGKKHDLIAVQVGDSREQELPDVGGVLLYDPESGEEFWLNTSSKKVRETYQKEMQKQSSLLDQLLRSCKADRLSLKTHESAIEAIILFFNKRRRGKRVS